MKAKAPDALAQGTKYRILELLEGVPEGKGYPSQAISMLTGLRVTTVLGCLARVVKGGWVDRSERVRLTARPTYGAVYSLTDLGHSWLLWYRTEGPVVHGKKVEGVDSSVGGKRNGETTEKQQGLWGKGPLQARVSSQAH